MTRLFNAVKSALTRTVFLYALCALFFLYGTDNVRIWAHARAATLSRLMPHFGYVVEFEEGRLPFREDLFKQYEHYFEKIDFMMPGRPDTLSMLGYVRYLLGKPKEAIRAYESALEINPTYFGSYYNLGVIYYQSGEYAKAVEYLETALKTDPNKMLDFIYMSKIYRTILRFIPDPEPFVRYRMKDEYRHTHDLLIAAHYKLGNYERVIEHSRSAMNNNYKQRALYSYFVGLSAFHLKQYKIAMMFLEETIKAQPRMREAYYHLGMILKTIGSPEAIIPLKQAELLPPGEDPAVSLTKGIRVQMF